MTEHQHDGKCGDQHKIERHRLPVGMETMKNLLRMYVRERRGEALDAWDASPGDDLSYAIYMGKREVLHDLEETFDLDL